MQEVLQEAFLKALRSNDRLQASLRDPVAWVFVLTMNVARDLRRRGTRRARNLPVEEVDPVDVQTTAADPLKDLERQEFLQRIRSEIVRLREPEKEVFLLKASGGCSFEAIASTLDIPIGTAKTRMRAALRQLRHRLAADSPEGRLSLGGER